MQTRSTLSNTALTVADDLRRAERSINLATRDTAQFLMTTLDATEAHGVSAAMTHRTVKATVGALASLVDGQTQMTMRAHPSAERVARQLGLSETSFGEALPKPSRAEQGVEHHVAV
ncbi:hypothetical protein QLH51_12935 [Sphingomonas sp. 2R-10]|uniref:hypothetical protein n=1 Tax=Sphingomonas sp. 2R-10 TaxID=3045148 RepID=UPI000F7AD8B0|nr:hypothetical protein [Sphingomonas sp. 2R-10]MDJ0277703.1 hypothetical protein [Sphingomonas sp. 2R-10]